MTLTHSDIRDLALQAGFDALFFAPLSRLTHWREASRDLPQARGLCYDLPQRYPMMRCALILIKRYMPYRARPGLVTLSAYYPASQAAHAKAQKVGNILKEHGHLALCHPPVPAKPLLVLSGKGFYGKNGLTFLEGFGSRFAIQLILTDLSLPQSGSGDGVLLSSCKGCGVCLSACPTGALRADGMDIARCLRAFPENLPLPEALRPLVRNSLLGCDLCQDGCPENHQAGFMDMPGELSHALDLSALLSGSVEPLTPWLGKNYIRKKRLQARACLIAGNLQRRDCLEQLRELAGDEHPAVREHAVWAIGRILSLTSSPR